MGKKQQAEPGAGANSAAVLRRALLRWYDLHQRDLPWRRTRDPYRIWVSEVMLQQTRVEAVIPYYENFLRRFPDVRKLAEAEDEQVLACWSGLGYYARARNLRKAARVILQKHGGRFPRGPEAAQALPGIGRYTAAAVLSIAYGIPLPVLDGNVARVLSRVYAIPADVRTTAGHKRLFEQATAILSPRRPGDFNQAMMELGATVCLPQQPRCPVCPLRRCCAAYSRNEVEKYPPARRQAKPVLRWFVVALIQDQRGRCLLVRRPARANWMAGFWELPMWEQSSANHAVSSKEHATGDGIVLERLLGRVRHTITENRLEVAVCAARINGRKIPAGAKWIAPEHFARYAVTTITRKALSRASR